jgi:hypothetical protein
MRDAWRDREQILANLQSALTLANELEMGTLAYLIERALNEAQAVQFSALLPQKFGSLGGARVRRNVAMTIRGSPWRDFSGQLSQLLCLLDRL